MIKRKKSWPANALAIAQGFNALSALAGGFGLMADPSGENLQMHTYWLKGTPFSDFLIPGIILFVVNGLGNTAGFALTVQKIRFAPGIGIIFGAAMVIWIITQVVMIGYMSFLQPLYFTTGGLQLIFGWMWHNRLRQLKTE